MNIRMFLFLGLMLSAMPFSAAYGREEIPGSTPAAGPASYRSVDATVLKVASGMVFFKTEEKTVRNLSMKEIDRNGIHSVKPGDKISLTVDRGNMILAVARPGEGALFAREITGTIQAFDPFSKWITVKFAGKERSFELKDAAATKLVSLQEGKITLVLDRENWVMDAYQTE